MSPVIHLYLKDQVALLFIHKNPQTSVQPLNRLQKNERLLLCYSFVKNIDLCSSLNAKALSPVVAWHDAGAVKNVGREVKVIQSQDHKVCLKSAVCVCEFNSCSRYVTNVSVSHFYFLSCFVTHIRRERAQNCSCRNRRH